MLDFMLDPGAMLRTFERNYLPVPAWPAVRTEVAKKVRYVTALPTGEDLDFNLRVLRSSGRIKMLPCIRYRQYAYPQSLSLNIRLQRSTVKSVIMKHSDAEVGKPIQPFWFLCKGRILGPLFYGHFRDEYGKADFFLQEAFPARSDPREILELKGTLPIQEGWKQAFFAGTLELFLEGEEAVNFLERAEGIRPTGEGANNLGVATILRVRAPEPRISFS